MDQEKLPPIPTPFSQRWREFRIRVLPFVVFIATLAAIVHLWRNIVQPVGMVGFVETNQVYVASLQDGLVSEIYVERFQQVKKDQPLCVIANTDPELIAATIAAAEAELRVIGARGDVDIARGRLNLTEYAGDLFQERILQVTRRVELTLAETNLVSAEALKSSSIIDDLTYQAALAKRDGLRSEIKERDSYIRDLEQNIAKLKAAPEDPIKASIMEAIKWKEKELELTLKPSILKAPFDGMITTVHHLKGEKVLRGSPIITVASFSASNIVGYVRQPIQRHPKPGDLVQVTTRTTPRITGTAQIVKVGAQLETLNPGLLSPEVKRMEVGLPVLIVLPEKLGLLPGEFVDIAFATGKQ